MTLKILLLGASGFVGQNIVQEFSCKFNLLPVRRSANGKFRLDHLDSEIRVHRPDWIINCSTSFINNSPDFFHGDAYLAEMLASLYKRYKFRLVQLGSVAEYGRNGCLSENTNCQPNTLYGVDKLRSTNILLQALGNDVFILRAFGLFGRYEQPHRLVPSLIESNVNNAPLLLSDGRQIRDFVNVLTLTSTINHILSFDLKGGVYNIGSGTGITIRNLVFNIYHRQYIKDYVHFGSVPKRSTDMDIQIADLEKISSIMPYDVFLTNHHGVTSYIRERRVDFENMCTNPDV